MARVKSKRGPKFTDLEREGVKERVALLDRRGYSQYAIAAELGVTQPMVHHYIEQIKEEYRSRSMVSREEAVQEKLEQYRELRHEAQMAWERSQQSPDGEARKAGDAAFLRVVQDVYKMECALLGLDEQPAGATKVGVQVNNNGAPPPPSLKDILDAAKGQMGVGRTAAPPRPASNPPQLGDGKNGEAK